MKCADCAYYWADEDEQTPYCHYGYGDGYAPCEVEDSEWHECDDDEAEWYDELIEWYEEQTTTAED